MALSSSCTGTTKALPLLACLLPCNISASSSPAECLAYVAYISVAGNAYGIACINIPTHNVFFWHTCMLVCGYQSGCYCILFMCRDSAAWCPYCQKVWVQLEEKEIPYEIEKVNMRCYGDKPASYTAKVPFHASHAACVFRCLANHTGTCSNAERHC